MVGAMLAVTGVALARDSNQDQAPVYGELPGTAGVPAPTASAKPVVPSGKRLPSANRLPSAKPVPSVKRVPSGKPVPQTRPRATPRPTVRVTPQPDRLPVRLRLPSVSADAPVVPVGVRSDRSLVLPPPEQVGWWIGGAQPGDATGAAVLAGHVDAEDGSKGALYGLTSVKQGDTVQVDTAAGRVTYRVVAMRNYLKQQLPAALFDQRGKHRLVLITCGGTFEPGRGYARNVVAYAEQLNP